MKTKSRGSPRPCEKEEALATCNLCGGRALVALPGPPAIVRCRDCGLLSLEKFPPRQEIANRYQEDYRRDGTGERFFAAAELAIRFFRSLRMRAILRRLPGPASLLDVGCGRGLLLRLFESRGWRVLGTELSRQAAEAARRHPGVEVARGELPALSLPAGSFQVITFFHVLEHLPQPAQYLLDARRLLADGGLLVVEVPNCAGLGFRLLGLRHFCADYPHHLLFFTPASLEHLLKECGFRVEERRYFSLEYSPYTTLQNLLNLLPGAPNRLYRALMTNGAGRRLRQSPWTWLHAALALLLAVPAGILSMSGLLLPAGNTMRFYCRKGE